MNKLVHPDMDKIVSKAISFDPENRFADCREFLKHLKEEHYDEILEVAKKENMSVETVEMMTVSNSKVFINY
jgi:hypothetical protein